MFNPLNQRRTIDAPPGTVADPATETAAGAPHRSSLRMRTRTLRWPFSLTLHSANGFGRPVAAARIVVHALAALLMVATGSMVAAPPAAVLAGSSAYDHDSQVMSVNHPDWMGRLPDSTPLGRISIPGTHDSMALHGGIAYQAQSLCGTSATPDNTSPCDITAQLNAGIRYLDIRLKCLGLDSSGGFGVYHGAGSGGDQHATFKTDVLAKLQQFLASYPSETVIMNVQDEGDDLFDSCAYNPDTNTYASPFEYAFAKDLADYPNLLWKPQCPPY
jgi:1-phosphatidylinositol phosphodiesterase